MTFKLITFSFINELIEYLQLYSICILYVCIYIKYYIYIYICLIIKICYTREEFQDILENQKQNISLHPMCARGYDSEICSSKFIINNARSPGLWL